MNALAYSNIELFRVRTHGDSTLRMYQLNPDGESLTSLITLTKGFYIAPVQFFYEGAPSHNLVVDTVFTPALTEDIIHKTAFVDLINSTRTRRFTASAESFPLGDTYRYLFNLHAAYNDDKAVV